MNEIYLLPLTRAEEAGKKSVHLVRAAARIAIIVQRSDKRVCLFVCHQTKGLELPGGAIEAGETPQQAGLRELSEEAGIQLPVGHPMILIDMIPIIDHRGGNWLDIVYGTLVTPLQLTARQEAELPVYWLSTEEIKDQVDQRLSSYSAAFKALDASELWIN